MSSQERSLELRARALQIRIDSIRSTTASGSGHPTTCLSAADITSVLFFESMRFDLYHPLAEGNDRFVLSKGHGVPVVYAVYKQLGIISDEELMQLREFDSPLEGHPTPRFAYNEAATGSLGQGLAIGGGFALNAKKYSPAAYTTYVLLGDGEIAEGSIWEAAEFCAYNKLGNLIAFVDYNGLGQTGETLWGHDVEKCASKFEAFGWHSIVVDGHNVDEILQAVEEAKKETERPTVIVAKTYKGYGIDTAEGKNGFHGKPFKPEDAEKIIADMKDRFAEENEYLKNNKIIAAKKPFDATEKEKPAISIDLKNDPKKDLFVRDEKLATRKAFGYALAALGRASKEIITLDADVKNSTYTQFFEDEFPERMVQCFIAEQTMVGVATGLEARGQIPFAATFGAFLSRAYDQIRMAGVGRNALRLCGSHSGVSIGFDGPSQMGLEDLAMMRAVPNSIVFYPSDAVSAFKLSEHMANYHDGISYMRTTRAATPMLYDFDEEFKVGGSKVLRQSDNDQACIVAAGITLHEALKAYEELKQQGVAVSVIDAYSVKPVDAETIINVAQKSSNRVIVVEDHYAEGGLGEAVASAVACRDNQVKVEILAVTKVSRSGKPEKLMEYAGIDAAAIVERLK